MIASRLRDTADRLAVDELHGTAALLRDAAEHIEVVEAERDLYADEVKALKRLAGLENQHSGDARD